MGQAGSTGWAGRLATFLATLALVLQIAVPAGFMVGDAPGGPSLIICTGHGAAPATRDHGQPGKAPSQKSNTVCAFAGHGGAPPTPQAQVALAAPFEVEAQPLALRFDLTPGRGLAAPPPPSQGPPGLIAI
jgi:hypothetical protein